MPLKMQNESQLKNDDKWTKEFVLTVTCFLKKRVWIFMFCILWSSLESIALSSDIESLEALAHSYIANRKAIDHFVCEFTVREGVGDNLDGVLVKGPTKDVVEARAVWAKSGDNMRYEVTRDITADRQAAFEAIKQDKMKPGHDGSPSAINIRLDPEQFLSDGKRTLHLSTMLGGGRLTSNDSTEPQPYISPISMAGMMEQGERLSPGNVILKLLTMPEHHHRMSLMAVENENGNQLIPVQIEIGDDLTVKYWIDTKSGFLCRRMEFRSNDASLPAGKKGIVTDVKEIKNGVWFPMRVIEVTRSKTKWEEGVYCREVVVSNMRMDAPPLDSDFLIKVEKGMVIHDGKDPTSSIRMVDSNTVRLSDFDLLSERMQGSVADHKGRLGGNKKMPMGLIIFWGNVVLIVIVVAAITYRRLKSFSAAN